MRKKNFPQKLSVSYANTDPLWLVRGEALIAIFKPTNARRDRAKLILEALNR